MFAKTALLQHFKKLHPDAGIELAKNVIIVLT